MKKSKLLALGLAVLLAFSVTGCGSSSDDSSASGEKIFRYSNLADIATIDPDKTNSVADTTVCYHIYDGLYRNVQGDVQPATAESYTVSDDGLTYTFTLRQDAKWSDGEPVTAQTSSMAGRDSVTQKLVALQVTLAQFLRMVLQ